MIVSKHPCIIIKDTEFITCNQIMYSKKRLGNIEYYEKYINILEKLTDKINET